MAENASVGLTRATVVATALRVVRREGVAAMTIRRLCDELGVQPPTIYYHVPNKQALLEMVSDAVMAQIKLPDREVGTWRERMRELVLETNRVLSKYPELAPILVREAPSHVSLDISEYVLETLLTAGFDPESAIHAYTAITYYHMGRLLTIAQLPRGRAARVPLRSFLPVAPRSESKYPSLATVRPVLADLDEDLEFMHGFEQLLACLVPPQGDPE